MMRHEDPSKFFTMRDKGVERKWQRERGEKEREREHTAEWSRLLEVNIGSANGRNITKEKTRH